LRNENNAGSFFVRKGPPDIVRDGLVLHLDAANPYSYVSGSTTWFDLSGNNNSGSVLNQPVFSSDNGGSIIFDGVNDIVRIGTVYPFPLPLGTNDVTINVWSKINNNDGAERFLFGTIPRFTAYNLGYLGNKMYAVLQDNLSSDTGSFFPVYGTTTLPLNTWIMTTVVMDRSSDIKLYLNGEVEQASGSIDISSRDNIYVSSSLLYPICVGGTFLRSPIRLHQGNISLVQVYFRTFSAEEVKQNYDAIKGRYGL
jgi:hypothetical protein